MYDFRCTDPRDIKNKVLSRKVRELKETEKGVGTMCKAMEEMRAEAAAEAAIAILNATEISTEISTKPEKN